MLNVLITLSKTNAPAIVGQTFDHTVIEIKDSASTAIPAQAVNADPWQATFTGVADGEFTVTATDVDTNGNVIGSPLSQSFNLSAPATFPQTTGISAAVAA